MSDRAVVLLLEDEIEWQIVVQSVLESQDYEVLVADSMSAGISTVRSRMVDAAVVDINLDRSNKADKDGLNFLLELDRSFGQDRTHVVMLSGTGTIPDVVTSMDRPTQMVIYYFEKHRLNPQKDEFIRQVARATDLSRSQREQSLSQRMRNLSAHSLSVDPKVRAWLQELKPSVQIELAYDDLSILVRNLVAQEVPLAPEIGIFSHHTTPSCLNLLFWSRRSGNVIEAVASGLGFDSGETKPHFLRHFDDIAEEKHWRTRYMHGATFTSQSVSFLEFLKLVEQPTY